MTDPITREIVRQLDRKGMTRETSCPVGRVNTRVASDGVIDNRDAFGVEPRFVLQLPQFAIGWSFLFGPENLGRRFEKSLNGVLNAKTMSFAIRSFSIAERFID